MIREIQTRCFWYFPPSWKPMMAAPKKIKSQVNQVRRSFMHASKLYV